jgi:nucleoside-diphosphate-sugar epimerase
MTIVKNILWTGSHGFIAGYAINKLLEEGHHVWGIDNFWKYGKMSKTYDEHPNFHFSETDAKDTEALKTIIMDNKINILVSGAAIIGGISMFHELAYFLLRENELITAAAFDACIYAHKHGDHFEKIVVVSSSMVFESTDRWPSKETDVRLVPPPLSTYGFQKLSVEYWAQGAWEQHKLPYTIIRPFNAVGTGEKRAKLETECYSGNIKLAMSHVVPDIVQKILKGQYPVRILGEGHQVRHYTYAGDLANGFYECIVNPKALNDDFNISTPVGHTVLELTKIIWNKINPDKEFKYECDVPFTYDVQKRVPDVSKAKEILGLECNTSLEVALDEIIPWIEKQIEIGGI